MLRSALKSLQWQTCPDFECLVLDDGSKDDTEAVVKEFLGDRRFRYRKFPEKGVPFCRNYGVRNTAGKFIAFLDDDDLYLPTRLEDFKREALNRPKAGFWFSNAYLWRFNRVIGTVFPPDRPIAEGRVPGYYAVGERYVPYLSTTMAISREAFDAVGGFNESLSIMCDTEIVARAFNAGFEVGVVRAPLAVRRLHEAQVTRDYEKTLGEGLQALKGANAPPEIERQYRRELVLENAGYFVKSLQTARARKLLSESGIERDARFTRLYLSACLPVPVLKGLKLAKQARLRLSCRGSKEYAEDERLIRSLFESEA